MRDLDNRMYHIGVKEGECNYCILFKVHNNILCMGSRSRAKLLSKHLHCEQSVQFYESERGFSIYSGKSSKNPCVYFSIVAIGMV